MLVCVCLCSKPSLIDVSLTMIDKVLLLSFLYFSLYTRKRFLFFVGWKGVVESRNRSNECSLRVLPPNLFAFLEVFVVLFSSVFHDNGK